MSAASSTPAGNFTVNEFLAWAAIGRTSFYKEVGCGRLVVRKIGTKTVVPIANAQQWRDALPRLHSGS